MADNFLFLELRDYRINLILVELRSIFSEKKSSNNIHITLKGPMTKIDLKKHYKYIEKYLKDNNSISIEGVGRFLNENFHVIYLKVNCGDLKKYNLWRKPDFDNSFNPHITLYKGSNKELADLVYNFLLSENIQFKCVEFEFLVYKRKQRDMFYKPNLEENLEYKNLLSVERNLLKRAKKSMEKFLSSNKSLQPASQISTHEFALF